MAAKKPVKKASTTAKKASSKKPIAKRKSAPKVATGKATAKKQAPTESVVIYVNDVLSKSLREKFLTWFKR